MKNPLNKLLKNRGIPDSYHVNYGNGSSSSPPSAIVPIASHPSTSPSSPGFSEYSYNSINQPPTAYPCAPQKDTEAVWEITTGNNTNTKGHQRTGNIKAGNSKAGSSPAINLPENGRFVFNAGGNRNEGDLQHCGNIEFANIG